MKWGGLEVLICSSLTCSCSAVSVYEESPVPCTLPKTRSTKLTLSDPHPWELTVWVIPTQGETATSLNVPSQKSGVWGRPRQPHCRFRGDANAYFSREPVISWEEKPTLFSLGSSLWAEWESLTLHWPALWHPFYLEVLLTVLCECLIGCWDDSFISIKYLKSRCETKYKQGPDFP